MTNTIVLDLDGPLLDGRLRHYACYRSILEERGYVLVDEETYWRGKRARQNRRELLEASSAGEFYEEFLEQWIRRIEQPEMLALDRLQPDVLEILGNWKNQGATLVLATMRNNERNTLGQLESLGLASLLDEILITGSDDGGAGKSGGVARFLSNHPTDHAIWVGDTEVDIQAARALGITAYAVTCGLRNREQLEAQRPDFLVHDLRDVRRLVEGSRTPEKEALGRE